MHAILLQAKSGGFDPINIVMIVLIFVVFYFFMIRPQQKKQKEQTKFRDDLKVGDRVVTIGGLHGSIVSMDNETLVLSVDNGVRLTFEKTAVSLESTQRLSKADKK